MEKAVVVTDVVVHNNSNTRIKEHEKLEKDQGKMWGVKPRVVILALGIVTPRIEDPADPRNNI